MQKQPFNHEWRFHYGDPSDRHWREPDDSTWRLVTLPHDWSIELPRRADNPSKEAGGYFTMGSGWYRKTFTPPESWQGKKVFIEFEGVYMNAEVWLDQNYLGRHPYGYTSFLVDLSPYLKIGAANVLKVRVDNAAQLNSRWYSGSGIYRPVWLIVAEPVHVAHWGVYITTPQVSRESAEVHIRTVVENESTATERVILRSHILAPDGSEAGTAESQATLSANKKHEFFQELNVITPDLWSPDHPSLYHLEIEVIAAGKVIDTLTTPFGIRSLHFDANQGFLLNGQSLKLKGGCVHHDNGVLGAASYRRSEERKVEIHKASGYNAIRCAHNPPAPAFLDACDRLGMMVIDEAFDCWREGKNPYDYHVAFDDWWQRDVDSMVFRDRNHPSIILWSIGNEVMERDGRGGGVEIARKLAERVRADDPTRPITSAINGSWDGRGWEMMDDVYAILGVGGYNYQWQQYQSDHQRHPQRMMVGTESFPLEAFENWALVEENNYVLGDFVWTSLDYLGESGIGRVIYEDPWQFLGKYPWHQANCGDLDLCGFKRPQSYYRDIVWKNETKLYIAVHDPVPEGKTPTISRWGWPEVWPNWNWTGQEGKPFQVDVYSACEKVELLLNGKSLGTKPSTRQEKYLASFKVPYEPGELKAIGYNGNHKAAECVVKTNGAPAQVRLSPDRSTLRAEPGDLCYVTVEIVDDQGIVHPTADRPVYFTVKGEGEIAAVGNANPVSTEDYRGNWRSTCRGRCLVVLKANGRPGKIHLRAQADDLDGSEVVIKIIE